MRCVPEKNSKEIAKNRWPIPNILYLSFFVVTIHHLRNYSRHYQTFKGSGCVLFFFLSFFASIFLQFRAIFRVALCAVIILTCTLFNNLKLNKWISGQYVGIRGQCMSICGHTSWGMYDIRGAMYSIRGTMIGMLWAIYGIRAVMQGILEKYVRKIHMRHLR